MRRPHQQQLRRSGPVVAMEAMVPLRIHPHCPGPALPDTVIHEGQVIPNGKPRGKKRNISCLSHLRTTTQPPNSPLLLRIQPLHIHHPHHRQNKMMLWGLSKEVASLNDVLHGGSLRTKSRSTWAHRPTEFLCFRPKIHLYQTEAVMFVSL